MPPQIHVLHENPVWIEPLAAAFAARGQSFVDWNLSAGTAGALDLAAPPPEGVFYNRMSASAHTRGNRYAPELTGAVLAWLEAHGRRVLNDSRALRLEVSKAAQYAALNRHGIMTPRTVAAVGRAGALKAAESFAGRPFILKPNRGGKGLGVSLFSDVAELARHFATHEGEGPVDGIWLVQDFVESPETYITRAEFIGGRLFYAVRVDTGGAFELCPADVCAGPGGGPQFTIVDGIDPSLQARYEAFLAANGVAVAGIEFITDRVGRVFTYDVNTNTNYNPDAERRAGSSGMGGIADFLIAELGSLRQEVPQEAA